MSPNKHYSIPRKAREPWTNHEVKFLKSLPDQNHPLSALRPFNHQPSSKSFVFTHFHDRFFAFPLPAFQDLGHSCARSSIISTELPVSFSTFCLSLLCLCVRVCARILGPEKQMNKKRHKLIIHGMVPKLSRDYPGIVLASS